MKKLLLTISALLVCASAFSRVESYEYPEDCRVSGTYSVEAGGKAVTVIQTEEPDVALLGADAAVCVKVKCLRGAPSSVVVRPSAKKYDCKIEGDVISLVLRPLDRVSVECDGNLGKPLFIFVNRPEKKPVPTPDMLYFKAGRVYDVGVISFEGKSSMYIEGGAVVKGYIERMKPSEKLTIGGCGILDARDFPKNSAIKLYESSFLKISDITVLNADKWTTMYLACDNSVFDNVHVVTCASHKANGLTNGNDGFNIISCRNVRVKHCFSYAHDDAFCIKSCMGQSTSKWRLFRSAEHISYEDCVAWNVGSGNSFEIGYETGAGVSDVSYKNIYAIHSGASPSFFRRAGISIHQGQKGTISNIRYKNVWIEDPCEEIVSIMVFKTPYKQHWVDWAPGCVRGVSITNLYVSRQSPLGVCIRGYDEQHKVSDVTVKNFFIEGKRVTGMDDALFRKSEKSASRYYDNIKIK